QSYTKVILSILTSASPDVILGSHTPTGRDLMPRIAARLGIGLASDCTQLTFEGSKISVRRPVYAGKATVEVEFLGSGPQVATVRANALGVPKPDASKTAEVVNVTPDLGELKTKVTSVEKGSSGRPDVTEASIVVSG